MVFPLLNFEHFTNKKTSGSYFPTAFPGEIVGFTDSKEIPL